MEKAEGLDLMAGVDDPTPGISPAKIPDKTESFKEPVKEKEIADVREEAPKEAAKSKEALAPKRMSIKEAVEDARAKAKKTDAPPKVEEPVVEEKAPEKAVEKQPAPVGWTKEAKDKWDTLDPDIQTAVLKREKEVSDGFKGTGEATKRVKNLDSLVEKLVPDHKQFGGSDRVVENTLQWLSAFRNPNKPYAASQLLAAAQSFGILDEVRNAIGGTTAPNAGKKAETTTSPATTTDPKVAELERKLSMLESHATQQQLVTAKQTIDDWSKDKPHFDKLRGRMTELFNNGTVKMDPSGQFTKATLEEAYNAAVRLDNELYQESLDAEKKRIKEELEAEAKRARQAAQLQNARLASSSIKTSPPAPKVAANVAANNNRKQSVREAIRSAKREVERA